MPAQDHEGHRERLRARFIQNGLEGFAPHEALELLLFFAIPRKDVNPLAHRLIHHFGSLEGVLSASYESLVQVPDIGERTATLLSLVFRLPRFAMQKSRVRHALRNLREAKAYCKLLFEDKTDEILYVICLDGQSRVVQAVPAITGTIDEIAVYPRTVVACALRHNAHSVVLAHNHPSGRLEPSDADIQTTEALRNALGNIDIKLLDHILYADGECLSIGRWQQMREISQELPQNRRPKAADLGQKFARELRSIQDAPESRRTAVHPELSRSNDDAASGGTAWDDESIWMGDAPAGGIPDGDVLPDDDMI